MNFTCLWLVVSAKEGHIVRWISIACIKPVKKIQWMVGWKLSLTISLSKIAMKCSKMVVINGCILAILWVDSFCALIMNLFLVSYSTGNWPWLISNCNIHFFFCCKFCIWLYGRGVGYPDLWPSPSCWEPLDLSKITPLMWLQEFWQVKDTWFHLLNFHFCWYCF